MAECTGQNVAEISKKECIGNSLGKINTNFTNLDISVCETGNSLEDLENLATTSLADYQNTIQEIQSRIPPPQIRAFVSFNTNSSIANAIYLTPGTFTWTATTTQQISARIVGGGGGGGGKSYARSNPGGGGGGGGGANLFQTVSVTAGTSYTVIVGGGGNGGAQTKAGSNGGNSKFGTLEAGGGQGGKAAIDDAAGGASGGLGGQNGGNENQGGFGGSSFGAGGTPNALPNSGGGGRGAPENPAGPPNNGGNGGSGRVELTYAATQGLQLIETYKINQVIRTSIGEYTIKFDPGTFPNTNYVMIATDTEIAQKSANELRIITKQNNVPVDLPNVSLICV